ncbi:MAG TPA: response regulator [Tissierellaceae bacterium]
MDRVIIADDEETIRNGLENLINSYDINLTVIKKCKDGKESIEAIEKYKPEIIIMDINMPHINGLDVIDKVKDISPYSKIIIISGYDKFEYAQKAIELGVFNYLLKPIDIIKFKDILIEAKKSYSERLWEINQLNEDEIKSNSIDDCISFIQKNYSNSELSLNLVAEHFFVSTSYLSKTIKNKTGHNFTDYLNKLRINRSIELLKSKKNYTIKEISDMVGYNSQHYFSRAFKNYTGKSPVQYKKEVLNIDN